MESVSPASSTDVDDLVRLMGRQRAAVADQRGGELWRRRDSSPPPFEQVVSRAMADPDRRVFAGRFDGVVVGYGVIRLERLRDGELLAVVEELYVDPDARGVGVGEAIMDACLVAARAAGCIGIDAVALPGDRASKNFFERFGLVARAIVVHRTLETDGDPDD